jgi:hypothetical protein
MVNIFAAIVITAFVVGAVLYLWFRSLLSNVADVLQGIDAKLASATDYSDERATRKRLSVIRQRVSELMLNCDPHRYTEI